jgi:hypothetical protein
VEAVTITQAVRGRIRELRRQRRRDEDGRAWSLADLARRLLEVQGTKPSTDAVVNQQMVLSRIETGERREITVAEFFAIAAALGVSPLALLPVDGPVLVGGGLRLDAGLFRAWILGMLPLRGADADFYGKNSAGFALDREAVMSYARERPELWPGEREALLAYLGWRRRQQEAALDLHRKTAFAAEVVEDAARVEAAMESNLAELAELEGELEARQSRKAPPRKRKTTKEGKR